MSFVENLLDSGLSDCLGFEEGLKILQKISPF